MQHLPAWAEVVEMARNPSETTLVIGHQMTAWVWQDRMEEALLTLLKVVRASKRELQEANAILERQESQDEQAAGRR
jgi:hypothetical protein